jgi:psiF repeat
MKIVTLVTAAAMAAFLMGGAALADSAAPAPAPAAPAATAPAKAAPAPMSAASIECSKEADAKGLHGTARKKFRAECKKNAAK